VNALGPKPTRLRLDPASCESLRQQILRRDGWRCQSCGTMSNLEIHHKQFRSHSGDDSEQNLITVCTACHANAHHRGNETDRAGARRKDCSFTTK
jgi:5-methylcytosine-specific restriction endonuclease McrA